MKLSIISFVIYIVSLFFIRNEPWFLLFLFGGAVVVGVIWTYSVLKDLLSSPPIFDGDIFGFQERNRLLREIRDELRYEKEKA